MQTALVHFDVQDWYWQVGGDQQNVFSSKRMAFVSQSDAGYVAWRANNFPTQIKTNEDLLQVILDQWVPSYLAQGVQIASTASPQFDDTYAMDPATQATITSIATSIAAGRGLPGGQTTFKFQGHDYGSGDFLNFANAAENWVYDVGLAIAAIILTGSGSLPAQPVQIA